MAVAPEAGEDACDRGASRSAQQRTPSRPHAIEGEPRMRIKKMSSPGRVLVGVLALLTPVALYATANSADAIVATSHWTIRVGNQADHMGIQGERFLPGDITINAGDAITWKARSGEPHTVTFL